MNNLNYLVRRYAIKKPISRLPVNAGSLEKNTPIKELNKPIASHVAIPVHKLVHTAMLDAANEAGLIPHDQPGQEQYKTFAKYSGMAHEELQNPDSPFTKLFNRHKSQIGNIDNPREHLKHALVPMFKYLAKHGEEGKLPLAEPHHEDSGESEPIDLLHSGYHPFEVQGDDGEFHYVPRVPSGFVEVPPKTKRRPYPNRNDVYKSIAEHADMGWSAPAKLADYISQKHGITPQEAATHIRNFNRRQNKPTAPTPTPTKRVWPPVARKSRRYDPTDLMAIIPKKKYMRVGDLQTHDQLTRAIVKNKDTSGLGPFADFLDEQGAPGAALAREAYHNSIGNEVVSPPFQRGQFWGRHDYNLPGTSWITEEGDDSPNASATPQGRIEASWEISRQRYGNRPRGGLISITHGPQTNEKHPENLLQYHVPVHSREHLKRLTADLPHGMQTRLWQEMARHLPETHEEPQQFWRKKYAKPGSTGASVQVTAKGEPYTATPNAQGYGITPNRNPINRVSRSYQVYCDQNGNPVSCSCPDFLYRHRRCKHMIAVEGIGKGNEQEPTEDTSVKMSAYKAPSKGVIVRGTQYTGGSFLPSMTGSFANPKRRMFKRYRAMLK